MKQRAQKPSVLSLPAVFVVAACALVSCLTGASLARLGLAAGVDAVTPAAGSGNALGSSAPSVLWLSQTGLYRDRGTRDLDRDSLAYSPQYPLWTDGAEKRRWVRIPRGHSVDASNPDDFVFPVGTQFFKEFRFGRAVETRLIERAVNGWKFATYVWQPDGRDAALAPPRGVRKAARIRPGVFHDVPSSDDCLTCHTSRDNPVLGFTALQLSPDRDGLALHAETQDGSLNLAELVRRGLVRGLPEALLRTPPRIRAENARGRAARGYFLGNCAHCHNAEGPLSTIGLDLDVKLGRPSHDALLATAVGRPSHFQPSGATELLRVRAQDPEGSVLVRRMASRDPILRMPPLGTRLVDDDAVELVSNFVLGDLTGPSQAKETAP